MELLDKGKHLSFVTGRKISVALGRKMNWTFNSGRGAGGAWCEDLCRAGRHWQSTASGCCNRIPPAPPALGVAAAGLSRDPPHHRPPPSAKRCSQAANTKVSKGSY